MKKITCFFLACCSLLLTSFVFVEEDINAETKQKALKILVISDLNSAYGDTTYSEDVLAVVRKIPKIKPDLILCGGDMVAGQKSTLTESEIENMWRSFNTNIFEPIKKAKIPFAFTLGNHDASPTFLKDRAIAKQFWEHNKQATGLTFVDATHYPYYYSYIKHNVYFISWDASAAKIKPAIYNWMKTQLAKPTAVNARMRILLGHLPLYAIVASKNKPGEVNDDPAAALAFFKENGIDLYISGHQHAYYPAHKNGIQLLNLGAIGNGPRPILGHTDTAKKAYTIINIPSKSTSKFTYQTYMPNTNISIALKTLPDSVRGFNGVINRIDN